MGLDNSDEIFAAKHARRKRLANLPLDQKIDLIEKLHELAKTMAPIRESFRNSGASGSTASNPPSGTTR